MKRERLRALKELDENYLSAQGEQSSRRRVKQRDPNELEIDVYSRNDSLLDREKDELVSILSNADLSRRSVVTGMSFCISNAASAQDCANILIDSIVSPPTPSELGARSAISRLYILSDVLHNTFGTVRNSLAYRSLIEPKLPQVFDKLAQVRKHCAFIAGKAMDVRVLQVLASWQSKLIFSEEFLAGLSACYHDCFRSLSAWDEVEAHASSSEHVAAKRRVENIIDLDTLRLACIKAGINVVDVQEQDLRNRLRLFTLSRLCAKQPGKRQADAMHAPSQKKQEDEISSCDSLDGVPLTSVDELETSSIDGESLTSDDLHALHN